MCFGRFGWDAREGTRAVGGLSEAAGEEDDDDDAESNFKGNFFERGNRWSRVDEERKEREKDVGRSSAPRGGSAVTFMYLR